MSDVIGDSRFHRCGSLKLSSKLDRSHTMRSKGSVDRASWFTLIGVVLEFEAALAATRLMSQSTFPRERDRYGDVCSYGGDVGGL
jgi:hypothetical protein